jgi:hypothetical protein
MFGKKSGWAPIAVVSIPGPRKKLPAYLFRIIENVLKSYREEIPEEKLERPPDH